MRGAPSLYYHGAFRFVAGTLYWLLEPFRFLVLRSVGDFGAAAYYILVFFGVLPFVAENLLLSALWFVFVGVLTWLAERIARIECESSRATGDEQ